jgi:hypothetical protein
MVASKPLRKSELLPLRTYSTDDQDLYYHEAQTSSLSWGTDEWFWTGLCLVDTYFGSEENRKTYFMGRTPGEEFDPPTGGRFTMRDTRFDQREYYLLKLDFRVEQVTTEYSALVETFNRRMEEYVSPQQCIYIHECSRSRRV